MVTDSAATIDGIKVNSPFALNADEPLTEHGRAQDMPGITPRSIATWAPALALADLICDRSGDVGVGGIVLFLLAGACQWVRRRASPTERAPSDNCLTLLRRLD